MAIEIQRDSLLSLYARTAAVFREKAQSMTQGHDYGITIGRARAMEEVLRRTRASETENFILVDSHIENLMNIAGTISTNM